MGKAPGASAFRSTRRGVRLQGHGARERYLAVDEAYKRNPRKASRRLDSSKDFRFVDGNEMAVAYRDPKTGDITVGVRGTDKWKDWTEANWRIGYGGLRHSPQYKETRELVQRVHEAYPDAKIDIGGHSLGGAIATELSREMGPEVVHTTEVWNPAVGIHDVLASEDPARVKRHHHVFDPLRYNPLVTFPGMLKRHDVTYGPQLWGHPLHNFEVPAESKPFTKDVDTRPTHAGLNILGGPNMFGGAKRAKMRGGGVLEDMRARYPDWDYLTSSNKAALMRTAGVLNQMQAPDPEDPATTMEVGRHTLPDGSIRVVEADGTVSFEGSEEDKAAYEATLAQERAARSRANEEAWLEQQDARAGVAPGTTKRFRDFSQGFVDVATKVGDFVVDLVPINGAVKDAYKAFAPPGSKYYQHDTLGNKVGRYVSSKLSGKK